MRRPRRAYLSVGRHLRAAPERTPRTEAISVANAVEITSANFQGEVVESDMPVLIDFWAEWCGPCRMIAPAIEELAGEYAGRVKVAKLDVDAEPGLASRYGVLSIPMIALFKDGEMVERIVGARPKDRIVSELRLDQHAVATA
jgi:thioredoxin 1